MALLSSSHYHDALLACAYVEEKLETTLSEFRSPTKTENVCCIAPPPPPVALCHHTVAVAPMAKHKCAATLHSVSRAPNHTQFRRTPPSMSPPPPSCLSPVVTAPTLAGTRLRHPTPPHTAHHPPPLPSPPFDCPSPAPVTSTYFSFFTTTPFVAFPLVCPLHFNAAFFFFVGFRGLGLPSSTLSLQLVVVLRLKEQEEGLGWRGRIGRRTRPSSSNSSNLSRAGGAGVGLSTSLTAASARAGLPAGVGVLPTSCTVMVES